MGYRLLAVAFGLALGGLISVVLVWWSGAGPASRSAEVRAIHRLDDALGYTLRPDSSYRHREKQFDVAYTIDASGTRRVPGFAPGRPGVLVLGDSWTFGHGVEDHETYAARLQAHWPELGVRNLGVMGYGTPHALLALARALEADDEVALVVYAWTPIHLQRSYLRASYLKIAPGGRTPRLEIENGELASKGLADASVAIADDVPGLVFAEWARTLAGVNRMAELAAEHGARFALVLLPGPASNPAFGANTSRMRKKLGRAAVNSIDLEGDTTISKSDDLFIPGDDHPNAAWHEMVADALAARLDPPVAHR